MTSRAQACACHDQLGSARTAVPDDAAEAQQAAKFPRIGYLALNLAGLPPPARGLPPRTA